MKLARKAVEKLMALLLFILSVFILYLGALRQSEVLAVAGIALTLISITLILAKD